MSAVRDIAREVFRLEAKAIEDLAGHLDEAFDAAVAAILACRGRVVVSGMGKAGIIGQKLSATLASTGTPSLSLHPAEGVHGDLGRCVREDLVLALSNSGETEEILRLVPAVKRLGARVVAITARRDSTLARNADLVLGLGAVTEADPMGFVPTASSAAMLALGDALAMAVMRERRFSPEEFARFHPAGDLGRRLMTIGQVMRSGARNPVVRPGAKLREALVVMTNTEDRPGATSIVDAEGKLVGFFTDGDLRRLLEDHPAAVLDAPIETVMTRDPKTLHPEKLAVEGLRLLQAHRVDQAPVVDAEGRAVGLLDVQDLLRLGLP